MKYYEITFRIEGDAGIMQDARDLLAALAGETGFETFEEVEDGLKGYVQTELFDENALKDVIADFPFEDVGINYEIAEAEYRDWNEQWEQEGFEPIIVDDRCVIHEGSHVESIYALTLQPIWHIAFLNHACQSIDECRLAYTRLPYEERVVLVFPA